MGRNKVSKENLHRRLADTELLNGIRGIFMAIEAEPTPLDTQAICAFCDRGKRAVTELLNRIENNEYDNGMSVGERRQMKARRTTS